MSGPAEPRANWSPKLDFTDQTLVYGSYAHGYKAGGANPPGATLLTFARGDIGNPIHPLTFKPEFVDAFELGTKNTLLDGALTLNGDVFYYNYKGYQISRHRRSHCDQSTISMPHIKGAELEATWEPLPGLKFNFAGGYEDARVAKGDHSVDLMDRTAGNPELDGRQALCHAGIELHSAGLCPGRIGDIVRPQRVDNFHQACGLAYSLHEDPALTGEQRRIPLFALSRIRSA